MNEIPGDRRKAADPAGRSGATAWIATWVVILIALWVSTIWSDLQGTYRLRLTWGESDPGFSPELKEVLASARAQLRALALLAAVAGVALAHRLRQSGPRWLAWSTLGTALGVLLFYLWRVSLVLFE